jgi:pyruvate,water dikinase
MPHNPAEVFDGDWNPDLYWTTTNFGEAAPGVLTPMTWHLWSEGGEQTDRRVFIGLGALERSRRVVPSDPRSRSIGQFHGRIAHSVNPLVEVANRLPGGKGAALAEQIIGAVPPDIDVTPTHRRLPSVVVKLPPAFVLAPRRLRATKHATLAWWRREIHRAPSLALPDARAQFDDALRHFVDTMSTHVLALFAAVAPINAQIFKLAAAAGDPELAGRVLAGQGSHAELDVIEDLWSLSRGAQMLETFLGRHGYHGPGEGELISRMWREDPEPVRSMVERYRTKPDSESPASVLRERAADRERAERALLAGVPRARRLGAKATLALAARYVPLRGVGKASFLQSIDVARAAVRRCGLILAENGTLDEPDDAFFLRYNELTSVRPGDGMHDAVAARRAERARLETLVLEPWWKGRPQVRVRSTVEDGARETVALAGIGACPGIIEAPVRVVMDPTFDDVEPGEILIAPVTDPSWASIMFTASALVVDIGGPLSHAAVVARELGIPCVMGTGDGTARLRTGDICRVDGHAGTVHLIRAAGAVAPAHT